MSSIFSKKVLLIFIQRIYGKKSPPQAEFPATAGSIHFWFSVLLCTMDPQCSSTARSNGLLSPSSSIIR